MTFSISESQVYLNTTNNQSKYLRIWAVRKMGGHRDLRGFIVSPWQTITLKTSGFAEVSLGII